MILEHELSDTSLSPETLVTPIPNTAEQRLSNAIYYINKLFSERFPDVQSGYKEKIKGIKIAYLDKIFPQELLFDYDYTIQEALKNTQYEQFFTLRDSLMSGVINLKKSIEVILTRDTDTFKVVDKIIRENTGSVSTFTNIDTYYVMRSDNMLHSVLFKTTKSTTLSSAMIGANSTIGVINQYIIPAINDYFVQLRDVQETELSDIADASLKLYNLYNSLVNSKKTLYTYINSKFYIIEDTKGGVKLVDKSSQSAQIYEAQKIKSNTITGAVGIAVGIAALLLNN